MEDSTKLIEVYQGLFIKKNLLSTIFLIELEEVLHSNGSDGDRFCMVIHTNVVNPTVINSKLAKNGSGYREFTLDVRGEETSVLKEVTEKINEHRVNPLVSWAGRASYDPRQCSIRGIAVERYQGVVLAENGHQPTSDDRTVVIGRLRTPFRGTVDLWLSDSFRTYDEAVELARSASQHVSMIQQKTP